MLQEVGYVNGIENYSRYFDGRSPGDAPYTLIDYFHEAYGENWLLVVDESHMTIPQIRGMYNGDRARKTTLIDFGFRLPAALDNRPLQFNEFEKLMPQTVYVSATPGPWELEKDTPIVEQLIRPTGLIDPDVTIKPIEGQVDDLVQEIKKRHRKKQRVLVTTLTKRTSEALTNYLNKHNPELQVAYLHSDIDTLDRQDILEDLRKGTYDVLIGINLLREGLDLPEVSLVAILDADKEGFLRSKTSLVQTMGRAARHAEGAVIMYADKKTPSMRYAIAEVRRRRKIQIEYNEKHGITPQSIQKPIREQLIKRDVEEKKRKKNKSHALVKESIQTDPDALTPKERAAYIKTLRREMRRAAKDLDFETAADLRDRIKSLEG
jgi:excinuclease ABC subunit B